MDILHISGRMPISGILFTLINIIPKISPIRRPPERLPAQGRTGSQFATEQYPGPYEGFVRKSEVVNLFDALPCFTNKIQADKKDAWVIGGSYPQLRGIKVLSLNLPG
jgi:hypothetical protein